MDGKRSKAQKLFFLHIPKTAGTSFVATVKGWFRSPHPLAFEFANNEEILQANDFVWGHITYDCFKLLPSYHRFQTVVAFREPFARLASHIQFTDRYNEPSFAADFDTAPSAVQEAVRRVAQVDLSNAEEIARFLADLTPWAQCAFHSEYVRFLTDVPRPPTYSPVSPVTDEQIRVAEIRLSSFDFLVLTEDLDRGVAKIAEAVGCSPPQTAERTNIAAGGRPVNYLDPDIREALAPYVREDLRIYKRARELVMQSTLGAIAANP